MKNKFRLISCIMISYVIVGSLTHVNFLSDGYQSPNLYNGQLDGGIQEIDVYLSPESKLWGERIFDTALHEWALPTLDSPLSMTISKSKVGAEIQLYVVSPKVDVVFKSDPDLLAYTLTYDMNGNPMEVNEKDLYNWGYVKIMINESIRDSYSFEALVTLVMHEIGHGLGFKDRYDSDYYLMYGIIEKESISRLTGEESQELINKYGPKD